MGNVMVYEKEITKYTFNENGLYFEDKRIAFCNPTVVRKVKRYDVTTKRDMFKYYINAKLLDGSTGKTIGVTNFENLSCFELWQCPDVEHAQKYIKDKLQMEAAIIDEAEEILCDLGFQMYGEYPIYILGDKVFCANDLKKQVVIRSSYSYPKKCRNDYNVIRQKAKDMIEIMPGVSEIIFYYAMQAVVKPLLHEWGIDTNYSLAVIGSSGHLKTSIARKICLWLIDKENQSESFSSSLRTNRILERMDFLSGMNYLVDDFHAYENTQDIRRQNKRLDDIVRHVESNPKCANVIITGEYLQGIFSCIDRTLMVTVPKMKESELADAKKKLSRISEKDASEIAIIFLEALLQNLPEVKQLSMRFYEDNINTAAFDIDVTTRTYRHTVFLRLTELLFRKYVCGDSREWSCKEQLEHAIVKQYKLQQRELKKYRCLESEDCIRDVYNMLNAENKYLTCITDEARYKVNISPNCFFQNKQDIYITKEALKFGMVKYYQHTISVPNIIRQLDNEGIIDRGIDSITKRFGGRRHYKISLYMLKIYLMGRNFEQ